MQVQWQPHLTVFRRQLVAIRQIIVLHHPSVLGHFHIDETGTITQFLPLTSSWHTGDDSISVNCALSPEACFEAAGLLVALSKYTSKVVVEPLPELAELAALVGYRARDHSVYRVTI